jgi:hydrogenase maturation factor
MHDPTEGGVAGGIHEMADVSNVGFKVYEERMPIAKETRKICEFFKIDPLQLVASGSLLIAVEKNHATTLVDLLKKNQIVATIIGRLQQSREKRQIVRRNGRIEELQRPRSDHLWQALEK